MIKHFNKSQREALADFFKNVAVGWFVAAFTIPYVGTPYEFLTQARYLVSMGLALYITMYLLKDTYEY